MDGPTWIGCSGWQYKDWRERFYPKGCAQRDWLTRYARTFPTVEVNSSFYRLPKEEAVARWMEQVPPGFRFALKGSKFVTQNKKLRDFADHAPLLFERIRPLLGTPHLGPILWQLPEGWPINAERLRDALETLPPGADHCFEFRHESWFTDEVLQMLRDHDVALAIGDHHERGYQRWELTSDWTFVRMHFSADDPSGRYAARELERLAAWLESHCTGLRDTWVYFNNDWNGYALENAVDLASLLGGDPWSLANGTSHAVAADGAAGTAH